MRLVQNEHISGINPSIAKLVYLLNFWGAETFESHAGFYPGDHEEQEYWAQRIGLEEEYNIKVDGPILLFGGIFRLPGGHIILQKKEVNIFEQLLPKYWKLNLPRGKMGQETDTTIAYRLDYEHPKLVKFRQKWDELYFTVTDQFNITEENELSRFEDGTWQKINELIVSELPLNQAEFNEIRNKGIVELELKLFQSIRSFENSRYKELVDKFIHDLNIAKGYDVSYFNKKN